MTDSPTPPVYAAPQPLSPSDEKLWATLSHVGGIVIGFIAPLLVFLILKDRSKFVEEHSKEALNFQILITGVQIINFILGAILTVVTFGLWGIIQILILLAALVVNIIFSIIGALAANRGETYRYPISIRFIK